MQYLKRIPIREEKYADCGVEYKNKISTLKKGCYCVVQGYSIMGEAPKSFIRVYDYQKGLTQRKSNTTSWPLYIAKTGHKWYPLESITEHLIARIGDTLGLNMAKSRLVIAGDQVRFLSKYFLNPEKGQELIHGIDILAAHLGDRTFIEEIALQKKEKEFFTLEDTIEAINQSFPEEKVPILESFFLMLCFDTWVGVQDRHFQNWGVVRDISGRNKPYFSPIYDSARGLFWNFKESRIIEWAGQQQIEQQIQNQINKSAPQMNLTGATGINHFELAQVLLSDRFIPFKFIAEQIFTDERLRLVQKMIVKEFGGLLSKHRLALILKCLEVRHAAFSRLLT